MLVLKEEIVKTFNEAKEQMKKVKQAMKIDY